MAKLEGNYISGDYRSFSVFGLNIFPKLFNEPVNGFVSRDYGDRIEIAGQIYKKNGFLNSEDSLSLEFAQG